MKKLLWLIPILFLMECSSQEKEMIFHYSVLKALDNGVLEGDMEIGELKKHGDFGLGTFNKLDGEMIILDNMEFTARSLKIGYDAKSSYKILLPDTEDFSKAQFRSEPVNY